MCIISACRKGRKQSRHAIGHQHAGRREAAQKQRWQAIAGVAGKAEKGREGRIHSRRQSRSRKGRTATTGHLQMMHNGQVSPVQGGDVQFPSIHKRKRAKTKQPGAQRRRMSCQKKKGKGKGKRKIRNTKQTRRAHTLLCTLYTHTRTKKRIKKDKRKRVKPARARQFAARPDRPWQWSRVSQPAASAQRNPTGNPSANHSTP